MGLNTTVSGDGKVISANKTRVLRPVEQVDAEGAVINVQFRVVEEAREVREWFALTEAAAQAVVDAAPQPDFGVYSYTMSEDKREVGSYRLTREFVSETDGPLTSLDACDPPTFTPSGGNFVEGDYPVSVTLESATPGATIRYATLTDGVLTSFTSVENGTDISIGNPGSELDTVIFAFATRAGRLSSDLAQSGAFTLDET